MTLRRTTDRLPHKRYGRVRLEFGAGEREITADEETEQWAAETYDEIERVSEDTADGPHLEDLDYRVLQHRAKEAGIAANQSREDIINALTED